MASKKAAKKAPAKTTGSLKKTPTRSKAPARAKAAITQAASPKAKSKPPVGRTKAPKKAIAKSAASSGRRTPIPSGRRTPVPGERRTPIPKQKAAWQLRLYVAGDSPRSRLALNNLRNLCEERLRGDYEIQVIDLTKVPHLAKVDQILAVPTLVRSIPEPMKRIIGDLSNADRALVALDLDTLGTRIP